MERISRELSEQSTSTSSNDCIGGAVHSKLCNPEASRMSSELGEQRFEMLAEIWCSGPTGGIGATLAIAASAELHDLMHVDMSLSVASPHSIPSQ